MSGETRASVLDLLPLDCDYTSDLYALVLGPKELRILFTLATFPARIASTVGAGLENDPDREACSTANTHEISNLLRVLRITIRDEVLDKRGGGFLGNTLYSE